MIMKIRVFIGAMVAAIGAILMVVGAFIGGGVKSARLANEDLKNMLSEAEHENAC